METEAITPAERAENIQQQRRAVRSRHGLRKAMVAIKLRGLNALDRRTASARALCDWRDQLIADLGGTESVSAQKMALIELATRTRLIIEHADHYIMGQDTLVNKRKRSLFPIVADRQRLVDSLGRLLAQLGLDRIPVPVKALHEYIQEHAKEAIEEKTVESPSPEPSPESWPNY